MARSVSFAMGLLLLLATMVAAAWGIHHARLGETRTFVPAEIAVESGVCHYTPGHLFAPPTAAEASQARAAWNDWGQVCRYDPSRGFGAYPTADELNATRLALGAWGTMDRGLAALWTLAASLGLAAAGHGLLVGSLSIFNPAFAAVGWWLLLPEIALAQAGWLGAAALLGSALGGLGPRYMRRRTGRAVVAPRHVRPWLTPKRIGLVAGGWLATVGVLAAVYPNIAKLLPTASQVAVQQGVPNVGSPSTVSGNATDDQPVEVAANETAEAVTPAPTPDAPPAAPEASGATPQQQQTAQLSMPNPFNPLGSTTGGSAGMTGGGSGAETSAPASQLPAEPVTSALQTIATYFPASTPGAASGDTPAADVSALTVPATATAPMPVPAPVQTVETPGTEASSAIAMMPIVDKSNPLPARPDAVLASTPSGETVSVETSGAAATGPAAEADESAQPEQPAAEEATPPPANPVPEPATLGLFALGAAALALRGRARNKR